MTWDDLGEHEVLVETGDELLWRNCAESWVDEGVPSKQLFLPTKKDGKKLSAARSSAVSVEKHFNEFRQTGCSSVGVWAVSVVEVEGVSLRAVDDSETGESALTGHCFIDFRQCATGGAIQRAARLLKDRAIARGKQHP